MVRETAYHDTLGVSIDASMDEIEKAYYDRATHVPPDKNHGDEKAAEDFRGLLGTHGMAFGSEYFVDYVGELASMTFSSCLNMEEETEDPEVRKKRAWEKTTKLLKERQEKLTTIMKDVIQPFVDGDRDKFENSVDSEARRLSPVAFGECLLHTVGIIYLKKAAIELKRNDYFRRTNWMKVVGGRKGFEMRSQIHAASEAEQEVEGIACRNRTEREKAEELRQSIFNLQDAAMSRLWCANVIDIEMTLSNVCKAILKDTTVSKDVLGLRAEALEKFGEIFKGGNLPYRREYSLCLEEAKVYENEEEDDST